MEATLQMEEYRKRVHGRIGRDRGRNGRNWQRSERWAYGRWCEGW